MHAAYHDIPAAVKVTNLTDDALALGDLVIAPSGTVTIDLHASRELNRVRRWMAILRARDGGVLQVEIVPIVTALEPVLEQIEAPSMPPADAPDLPPANPATL